ncbi:MAG: tol-pal system protein YbgF [Thermoanaerobaculia bacterium]
MIGAALLHGMNVRRHFSLQSMQRPLVAAAIVATSLTVGGCVSSSDIEALHDQIADVQKQATLLQQQGSSKQEVAGLESTIQKQTDALLKAEADMRLDVSSLSAQIAQLQDKLEDTNYRLAQVSQQIATTNQDLKASRTSPAVPGAPGDVVAPAGAATSDPETLYQTSYSDYLRGNYDLAMMGFKQYLEAFPETDLADNAIYWIGECYYRQQKYVEAIAEYDKVLKQFARSDKTASALLKKGFALLEQGQKKEGIAQLQSVIKTFPSSDEANLAKQRLQSLGVDPGNRK